MRSCAQSSQRSTWPPSAAVRQVSIADMTPSWAEAHVTGVGLAPRRPVGAKDVGDLQLPGRATRRRSGGRRFSSSA